MNYAVKWSVFRRILHCDGLNELLVPTGPLDYEQICRDFYHIPLSSHVSQSAVDKVKAFFEALREHDMLSATELEVLSLAYGEECRPFGQTGLAVQVRSFLEMDVEHKDQELEKCFNRLRQEYFDLSSWYDSTVQNLRVMDSDYRRRLHAILTASPFTTVVGSGRLARRELLCDVYGCHKEDWPGIWNYTGRLSIVLKELYLDGCLTPFQLGLLELLYGEQKRLSAESAWIWNGAYDISYEQMIVILHQTFDMIRAKMSLCRLTSIDISVSHRAVY